MSRCPGIDFLTSFKALGIPHCRNRWFFGFLLLLGAGESGCRSQKAAFRFEPTGLPGPATKRPNPFALSKIHLETQGASKVSRPAYSTRHFTESIARPQVRWRTVAPAAQRRPTRIGWFAPRRPNDSTKVKARRFAAFKSKPSDLKNGGFISLGLGALALVCSYLAANSGQAATLADALGNALLANILFAAGVALLVLGLVLLFVYLLRQQKNARS